MATVWFVGGLLNQGLECNPTIGVQGKTFQTMEAPILGNFGVVLARFIPFRFLYFRDGAHA